MRTDNVMKSRIPTDTLVSRQYGTLQFDETVICYKFMFALRIEGMGDYPITALTGLGFHMDSTQYREIDKATATTIVAGFSHDPLTISMLLSREQTGMEDWKDQLWRLSLNSFGMRPVKIRRNMILFFLDINRNPILGIRFKKGLLTDYVIDDLDALTSGVVGVKATVVHEGWDFIRKVRSWIK